MRALARDFSAETQDDKEQHWDLRLLPQPLYRYESTDPDVLDGAVFAFVTSAGTDPEAILVLEARKPAGGGEPVWHYAVARFTDLNLWVRHKGTVVFTAVLIPLQLDRPGWQVPLPRLQGPVHTGHPGSGPMKPSESNPEGVLGRRR